MKQLATLIFLSLFIVTSISAQEKWSWGVKTQIGVNAEKDVENNSYENLTRSTKSVQYTQRMPSVGGGLWVQYQFAKNWGWRSGLQYANVGSRTGRTSSSILKATGQQTSYYASVHELRLHRIQIPLILEYRLSKAKLSPFLGAGLVFSKDITGQIEEENYNNDLGRMMSTTFLSAPINLKKTVFQFTFNLGLNLTDQLAIEINHLIGKDVWDIIWYEPHDLFIDPTTPESIIFCGIPTSQRVKANYQQQTNLEIRYQF